MTRPADTSPEAWAVQNALWQRMTGDQRVRLAIRMSEDAREISKSGIRHRHPEYSEEEAEWALRRLMLGDALFTAAWPDKPRLAP
jgi:hypothetical protein